MNSTHPTDTVTYTQNELECLLQAERTKMATMFTGRVLNGLQTISKLFLSTEAGAVPAVDLVDIGEVLELVTMGAHMQTLRIATQENVNYDAAAPYSYVLQETMSNWTRLQERQANEGC